MAGSATASAVGTGVRTSSSAWPLYALFVALPIWWVLGAAYFIWPLLTFPLLFVFLMRGNIKLPPRFGVWLLFLAWMLIASLPSAIPASTRSAATQLRTVGTWAPVSSV